MRAPLWGVFSCSGKVRVKKEPPKRGAPVKITLEVTGRESSSTNAIETHCAQCSRPDLSLDRIMLGACQLRVAFAQDRRVADAVHEDLQEGARHKDLAGRRIRGIFAQTSQLELEAPAVCPHAPT